MIPLSKFTQVIYQYDTITDLYILCRFVTWQSSNSSMSGSCKANKDGRSYHQTSQLQQNMLITSVSITSHITAYYVYLNLHPILPPWIDLSCLCLLKYLSSTRVEVAANIYKPNFTTRTFLFTRVKYIPYAYLCCMKQITAAVPYISCWQGISLVTWHLPWAVCDRMTVHWLVCRCLATQLECRQNKMASARTTSSSCSSETMSTSFVPTASSALLGESLWLTVIRAFRWAYRWPVIEPNDCSSLLQTSWKMHR